MDGSIWLFSTIFENYMKNEVKLNLNLFIDNPTLLTNNKIRIINCIMKIIKRMLYKENNIKNIIKRIYNHKKNLQVYV